jgi:hypothetical protein
LSNQTLYWLTGLGVACVMLLMFMNLAPVLWSKKDEKYIKYNDVRGMSIEHNQKVITLNFDQQNEMVGFFNQSEPAEKVANPNKQSLDFTKIIINRFNAPDLIITPIEYQNSNLIFSTPDWNEKGLLKDTSNGRMKKLISQTLSS